jgi:hypothetical protein
LTTQSLFVGPPPSLSKKNDSPGNTRIKRALSTSIIRQLYNSSKKNKKQKENIEKREKKDKNKSKNKDKKETSKLSVPLLAQIGKRSTIAEIKYSFLLHQNNN